MPTKGREPARQNAPMINDEITADSVLLIGVDGEQVGTIPTERALSMAKEAGLDLMVVSEGAAIPTCKIVDYGKYRYEANRKKTESRKKQKIVELKEVQVRPSIGDHDLSIKCKAINKFIEEGKRVKLVLRFRGRELSHREVGLKVMAKILEYCQDTAKEEMPPKMEGSAMITVLAKKK
ncbi:MAG: translation initiation factor IF-3 [Holosporales bacterium]|jgi:translation initiation factor IF-3|nr:translation initiation factor IF-3 [Holosporales bacterium]